MAAVQPKKPAGGAYGVFMGENRAEFQKRTKGQPITAVAKMGSEEWKKLPDAQKAPFQKKYEAAKAKYEADMAAFLAAGGVKQKGAMALRAEKRKAKEGKKKKDPNAPKRPAGGAFGVWLNENRAAIVKSLPAGHRVTDVSKAGGVQWKAMSDAAKKPFQSKYEKKQAEYKAAVEEYKKANGGEAEEAEDDDDEEEEEEEAKPAAKKGKKA